MKIWLNLLISLPWCQVMEEEYMEVEVDVVREVVELSVLIIRGWDTLKKCVIPCIVSQCIHVSQIEHRLFEDVYSEDLWLKSNCKAQPSSTTHFSLSIDCQGPHIIDFGAFDYFSIIFPYSPHYLLQNFLIWLPLQMALKLLSGDLVQFVFLLP